MSKLRIKYGPAEPGSKPIFFIDITSSDIGDENAILFSISRIIDLAIMLHNAKMVIPDQFMEADINEQFPLGVCSFLYFDSHEEGFKFMNEMLNAFQ